jgi:hypothetical protein
MDLQRYTAPQLQHRHLVLGRDHENHAAKLPHRKQQDASHSGQTVFSEIEPCAQAMHCHATPLTNVSDLASPQTQG